MTSERDSGHGQNDDNMNPKDSLKHIGLNEKESQIYLSLLELGSSTVLTISKRSGIKRPTAYLVLQSLVEKGFASRVIKEKKTFFSPQHPKKLITESELRLKELQEVVPQLEIMFRKRKERPQIRIFEGKDELDRAYDDLFFIKGNALFMGTSKLSMEAFPRSYQKQQLMSRSQEFTIRELVDESKEGMDYANKVRGEYHEFRFIPKKFLPFEADIGIFGNHTLITSVKKEYFTIDIESKEIARAFRTIFEMMWLSARNV
jgi:predicted transcriptional regulator